MLVLSTDLSLELVEFTLLLGLLLEDVVGSPPLQESLSTLGSLDVLNANIDTLGQDAIPARR